MIDEGCALCLNDVPTIANWFSIKEYICRPCAHQIVFRFEKAHPNLAFWDPTYIPQVRDWVHSELRRVSREDTDYDGVWPGQSLANRLVADIESVVETVEPEITKNGQFRLF